MTLTKLLRTSAAALGALAVASVTQANAADIYTGGGMKDIPVYLPPTWTGFYIGANAGVDWSSFNINQHTFTDTWSWDNYTYYDSTKIPNHNLDSTGGFIGGQFGYNFQYGSSWVYGIEVDLGAMTVNNKFSDFGQMGNKYGPIAGVLYNNNNNNDMNFYGDVTGRLGYTWGSTLIYAKGGFAWLENNFAMRETMYWNGGGYNTYNGNNNDNTATGWVVGAGVEWKVSPSWSLKAEYLHFDFGNNNNSCCNDYTWNDGSSSWNNNFHNNSDLTVDTVKIGFNYFCNPAPPAPLK